MKTPFPLTPARPEAVGIPSQAVIRFLDRLAVKRLPMHSVLMVRGGQLAVETYAPPFDAGRQHRMYSTSKSFVAVAIGILIGEGKLKLDDEIASYFPDKAPAGLHPYTRQVTVRDLLLMATPLIYAHCTYSDRDPDWADTYFRTPPTHRAGQIFSYDTTATVMLSILIKRISGQSLTEYLRSRLFEPAGMNTDIACVESPCGHDWGGSGILCTPRDLAVFAQVSMNEGRINSRQLVPADFMRAATSRLIDNSLTAGDAEHRYGYGYQFWRTRHNGFACRGMGCQLAVCLPDHDFILVTTGDTQAYPAACTAIYDALWTEILPSLQAGRQLPPDTAGQTALQQRLKSFVIPTVEGETGSSLAASVSGLTYAMDDNPMGIKTVCLRFEDGQGVLAWENATGQHRLRFGLGHHIRQAFPETHYHGRRIGQPLGRGYDCLSSAAWVMPNSLLIITYSIDEHIGTLKMLFAFDGDTITTLMDKHAEWFFKEYVGFASGTRQV